LPVPQIIKPPHLQPGQTIGLIAPSGAAQAGGTAEAVGAARARLDELGYKTVVGRHAFDAHGHLAGTDADRAADLHTMFRDPDVHAVLCVRGGYGAMRLLEDLDYDLIRRHPKVFVGFSDITALHLAFHRRTGLVTFHGPMAGALAQADPHDLTHLLRAVSRPEPLGPLANPAGGPAVEMLVPGSAEGMLVGGNLALVTALLGTPYRPAFEGAVVFLEDIVDHAYRLDRKLMQLRLAGALDTAAGIVIGECRVRDGPPEPALTVREILRDLIAPLGKPAIYGLACGHGTYHLTLPIGVRARLDATRGVLSIEEAAVV
jgi:muramoyltetrapeptide carboxypeptidase